MKFSIFDNTPCECGCADCSDATLGTVVVGDDTGTVPGAVSCPTGQALIQAGTGPYCGPPPACPQYHRPYVKPDGFWGCKYEPWTDPYVNPATAPGGHVTADPPASMGGGPTLDLGGDFTIFGFNPLLVLGVAVGGFLLLSNSGGKK
jgi:hypothetical protein